MTMKTAKRTIAANEIQELGERIPNLEKAYPLFFISSGMELSEVVETTYQRWNRGYWGGSLVMNRSWETGEREALSELYLELAGEKCEDRFNREQDEAEKWRARGEDLERKAVKVIRSYQGTRLYGALRRAGLEEILKPEYSVYLDYAISHA